MAEVAAELSARWPRPPRRASRPSGSSSIRDRVCQTAGAQLWCAGAAPRDCVGGERPSSSGRRASRSSRRGRRPAGAERGLGHRGRRDCRGPRGRPIVRVHAVAEMVQVVRVAEEIAMRRTRRRDCPLTMDWLSAILSAPACGWWDLARHPRRVAAGLRSPQADSRTRAVQMAIGGGVLVALFYGSRLGHLETVNWLIRNLLARRSSPSSCCFSPTSAVRSRIWAARRSSDISRRPNQPRSRSKS